MTVLSHTDLAQVTAVMRDAGADIKGPLEVTVIAGGRSNVTCRLDDGTSAWVLRMPPRLGRTPSAHDMAREFRVTSALHGNGVPVPPPVVLCEDESRIGVPFAVSEFVRGTTVQSREHLMALDDAAMSQAVTAMLESLAALHAVDHVAVGLERFGRPTEYAARQLRRWSGQWDVLASDEKAEKQVADELRATLAARIPDQPSTSVVHGDYRIDNTLIDLGVRPPKVVAIVDWELSTIGDPVADVAMMCAYRHPAFDLILGSSSAWTSDRLPTAEQLAAAYVSVGGVPLANWHFHLSLAYFKVAVIAAGIDHRFKVGATTGQGFDTAGQAVLPMLQAGLDALRVSS